VVIGNPTEKRVIAARIHDVNVKTLTAFINRNSNKKHEEHNKILEKHEEEVIEKFIRSLLICNILLTTEMMYGAVVSLKRAHNRSAPTKVWFRGW
jgi:hypothetical protein